jgi:ubiquinone/menaquinone biosynthesis C-methylase UbiE
MGSEEFNCYQDDQRAESYARLEFPGTYFLAYRDIPKIIAEHATGKVGLDFGCGTGRSTRFLRKCGFEAIGVDIAANMLEKAHEIDPDGDYRLVGDGDFGSLGNGRFDLILSVFTFDNIPGRDRKIAIFSELKRLLKSGGKIVSLVSAP